MPSSPQVLLTGFPSSLLARRLATKVLREDEGATVLCPVPTAYVSHAREAVGKLPPKLRPRLEVVDADVSAMDFGMSGKRYIEFAKRIDVIHHVPSATTPGIDREVATRVNLGGGAEVLELAELGNVEHLIHWSSTLVSGKRKGHILESELIRPSGFRNVVEETLFRTEVMMREAMDHVPITVLRPSIIVGDSKSGEIDRLEGPYLLILLMLSSPVDLRVPLPGRGDTSLNLVPIDYVVDAGYAIGADPNSIGRTFHIVDSSPPTARRVFELIAEEVGRPGPVGALPTQLATALLRTPGLERFSHIPRAFLEQLATDVEYDARNTDELLAGRNIHCPSAPTYMRVMVDHVRQEHEKRAGERRGGVRRGHPRGDDTAEDPLA